MLLLSALSAAWATVIAGAAGAIGAVIGALAGRGYFTTKAAVTGAELSGAAQRQEAADEVMRLACGSALLMQDDFLHYQVTLARCLDACRWWTDAEILPTQATLEDRKAVWAHVDAGRAETVAGAQGWVDYLINTRGLQPKVLADGTTPPLTPSIVLTMRSTFELLDSGREALAELTQRAYAPFEQTFDMDDQLVNCHNRQTAPEPSHLAAAQLCATRLRCGEWVDPSARAVACSRLVR